MMLRAENRGRKPGRSAPAADSAPVGDGRFAPEWAAARLMNSPGHGPQRRGRLRGGAAADGGAWRRAAAGCGERARPRPAGEKKPAEVAAGGGLTKWDEYFTCFAGRAWYKARSARAPERGARRRSLTSESTSGGDARHKGRGGRGAAGSAFGPAMFHPPAVAASRPCVASCRDVSQLARPW